MRHPPRPPRRAGVCRCGDRRAGRLLTLGALRPVRSGGGACGQGRVRGLHPLGAAGLLTREPQVRRGRRPLLPGFTRPAHGGEPAYRSRQRRGARVSVTARWPVWLPGTWPRVPGVAGSADGDPLVGHAHSSVCACAELRGAQAFCPSSVSQGALDGGFHTGASFPYDGNSKPAFVKIVGRTYPFQKSLRNILPKSLCVRNETGGALPPPASLSLEPHPPALVGDSHPRGHPLRDSQSGLTSKNDLGNYF